MVKAIVTIDDRTNRILNILKAKYGLKDKSQAINLMAKQFEACVMEPRLEARAGRGRHAVRLL